MLRRVLELQHTQIVHRGPLDVRQINIVDRIIQAVQECFHRSQRHIQLAFGNRYAWV